MKTYTPNWNDPRVIRSATKALSWATQMLKEDTCSSWSSRHLDTRLGCLHNSLGCYLRNTLLTLHNSHYSMTQGYTKQYRLNLPGAAHIAQKIGINPTRRKIRTTIGLTLAKQQYGAQLIQGAFEYTEKNNRCYNELQNIRTDIRKHLFADYGYRFNYDIQNAYPSILLDYAQKNAKFRKPLTTLKQYALMPNLCRDNLARDLRVSYAVAKEIIIARVNGGSLRTQGAINSMLTRIQMYRLKHNTWFAQLTADVKRAWQGIARSQQRKNFNNRAKMNFYLTLENQVMRVIRSAFSKKNIDVFLEHDGWRAKDYIDPHVLELLVLNKTNCKIKLCVTVIDSNEA